MPYLRLCRRDVPVVINVSINEYLVCKPYRKLTSRTPHVENLDIYGVVFLVRKPNRREMYPVVVGRVFILFENKAAARFFKQAVVKCGAVAVVVEFREQHICGLASGAVLRISGEVGTNAYLYSIAARAVDTTVSSSIPSSGAKVFAARSYTPYVRSPSQTTSNGAVRPSAVAPPALEVDLGFLRPCCELLIAHLIEDRHLHEAVLDLIKLLISYAVRTCYELYITAK